MNRRLPRLAALASALFFTMALFQGVAGLAAPEHGAAVLAKAQSAAAIASARV